MSYHQQVLQWVYTSLPFASNYDVATCEIKLFQNFNNSTFASTHLPSAGITASVHISTFVKHFRCATILTVLCIYTSNFYITCTQLAKTRQDNSQWSLANEARLLKSCCQPETYSTNCYYQHKLHHKTNKMQTLVRRKLLHSCSTL